MGKFINFMKITKLEITILIDLVAITAFILVPGSLSHPVILLFLVISGTMASMSASMFNNIYDMDIDTKMKRTRSRSVTLNSGTRSFIFGIALAMIVVSFSLSLILINLLTALFIFAGFLSYVFLYTIFLKRRTTFNIVIGGIAGSFPALAGWAALTNSVSLTSLFLAFLVFMWTPTHFWNLSINNVDDYKASNVPMLPAIVGIKKTEFWIVVNTILLVFYSLIPLLVPSIKLGLPYIPVVIVMDTILLYYVIRPALKSYDKKYFRSAFGFSNMYLLLLLLVIIIYPFI
jgi:protoheme IX farnesyltransferase